MSERRPLLKDAGWLREGALGRLLQLLNTDGEEARVVGGAVRNALLGEPIGEIDLATTAVPEEVVLRTNAAGHRPVPTGIEHGTVTVVIEGRPFEVTSLREDIETDGRRARVRFGRDWAKDAARRDFTINALSATPDGDVHDYVGGFADLELRRVRFIGDARKRIEEDFLRILRFFRFHAAYGHGAPDREGLLACIAMRAGIEQLSRERVRMETMKLLAARFAPLAVAAMSDAGLLVPVLGGVADLASLERLAKIESVLYLPADPVRRLGALAARLTEDAERLWQRLRLSNAEHERLVSMSENFWRVVPGQEKPARGLLYALGPEGYADRVLLAWARARADARDDAWAKLLELPKRWTAPEFPLRAADFVSRGIAPGPALGEALRAAEIIWIAADFPAERAALDAIAASVADRPASD